MILLFIFPPFIAHFILGFQDKGNPLSLFGVGLLSFFWIAMNLVFYNTSHYKMPLRMGIGVKGVYTECGKEKYNQFIAWDNMVFAVEDAIPRGGYTLTYYADDQKKKKEPMTISPEVYNKIALRVPRIIKGGSGGII